MKKLTLKQKKAIKHLVDGIDTEQLIEYIKQRTEEEESEQIGIAKDKEESQWEIITKASRKKKEIKKSTVRSA